MSQAKSFHSQPFTSCMSACGGHIRYKNKCPQGQGTDCNAIHLPPCSTALHDHSKYVSIGIKAVMKNHILHDMRTIANKPLTVQIEARR